MITRPAVTRGTMRAVWRVAVVLLAVGASGGARAERLLTNPVLPDPTDRLRRWPLTSAEHPELAPRYPVAKELAEPGIDWITLCDRGAQHRVVPSLEAQTAYLHAWCAVARRDTPTALRELRALLGSPLRQLAPAVRADLANLLVAEGSADAARPLLVRAGITDLGVHDRLAALFVDLDQPDDALEITELALDSTAPSSAGDICMRKARRVVLGSERAQTLLVQRRSYVALHAKDPTCIAVEAELACFLGSDCGDHLRLQGTPRLAAIYDTLTAWKVRPQRAGVALERLIHAARGHEEQAAVADVVGALLATSVCKSPESDLAFRLYGTATGMTDLDPEIRSDMRARPTCRDR